MRFLLFKKSHSLFKLRFKSTQLEKIPKYDIFQKVLFFILASNMNLGLNAVPLAGGQYLWRFFFVFKKLMIFRVLRKYQVSKN